MTEFPIPTTEDVEAAWTGNDPDAVDAFYAWYNSVRAEGGGDAAQRIRELEAENAQLRVITPGAQEFIYYKNAAGLLLEVTKELKDCGAKERRKVIDELTDAYWQGDKDTFGLGLSTLHWIRTRTGVPADPAARAQTPGRSLCEAFAWVGQPLTHCDDCGRPYWEHTHERGVGQQAGDIIPITAELAAARRRKWDPDYDESEND
ncbi:hypothetical protein ACFVAJ_17440 [Agromyces sp. NPDC057679]|uniref:hypothetical protein n=1 Tax=Agromyces sp. NPDC057679 TaxID=3346207 RepID=UPI00366E8216